MNSPASNFAAWLAKEVNDLLNTENNLSARHFPHSDFLLQRRQLPSPSRAEKISLCAPWQEERQHRGH
jgi:hypothetical protein